MRLKIIVLVLSAVSCFSQAVYDDDGRALPEQKYSLTAIGAISHALRSQSVTFTGDGKRLTLTFTKDSVITKGDLLPDEAAKSFIKHIAMRYIATLDSLQVEIDLCRRGDKP
jgi:hypothetical protein